MKFTPDALISTTASFAFGSGAGRSTYSIASGPPVFLIWIAFMLAFDAGHSLTAAGFAGNRRKTPGSPTSAAFAVVGVGNSCFLTFCPGHSLRGRMDAIDAAAVQQVLNGNHDAFKIIVDRHSR